MNVILNQFLDQQVSPVHKLLGNFSATLGSFSNFQLVEQLSVHRATFSHSYAPAASETIKKCGV